MCFDEQRKYRKTDTDRQMFYSVVVCKCPVAYLMYSLCKQLLYMHGYEILATVTHLQIQYN